MPKYRAIIGNPNTDMFTVCVTVEAESKHAAIHAFRHFVEHADEEHDGVALHLRERFSQGRLYYSGGLSHSELSRRLEIIEPEETCHVRTEHRPLRNDDER